MTLGERLLVWRILNEGNAARAGDRGGDALRGSVADCRCQRNVKRLSAEDEVVAFTWSGTPGPGRPTKKERRDTDRLTDPED